MEQEKIHELWCKLVQKFAESAEGEVTIIANSVVDETIGYYWNKVEADGKWYYIETSWNYQISLKDGKC